MKMQNEIRRTRLLLEILIGNWSGTRQIPSHRGTKCPALALTDKKKTAATEHIYNVINFPAVIYIPTRNAIALPTDSHLALMRSPVTMSLFIFTDEYLDPYLTKLFFSSNLPNALFFIRTTLVVVPAPPPPTIHDNLYNFNSI